MWNCIKGSQCLGRLRTTDLTPVHAAIPKHHPPRDLKKEDMFTVLKAWMPQIKAPAEWMPADCFLVPNRVFLVAPPSVGGARKEPIWSL